MLNEGGMTLGMQDTLHALADPTRREILNLLKHSRLSAGEISNHFSISGAAISRHLSVLKEADLIRDKREGKFIYYELNAIVLEEILLWICPLVSLFVSTAIYGYSLGYDFNISYLCGALIGVLYLVLGNFLPTVKPNYTIGFRIPWALNDPDNWYHTHRFGGKCMVVGGIIMILTSLLQSVWILLAAAMVPCLLPVIYSYLYYRKA